MLDDLDRRIATAVRIGRKRDAEDVKVSFARDVLPHRDAVVPFIHLLTPVQMTPRCIAGIALGT